MSKTKTEPEALEPDAPEHYPTPEPEAVPVGEMRDGYRTPMDNPAHPLHHLRGVF